MTKEMSSGLSSIQSIPGKGENECYILAVVYPGGDKAATGYMTGASQNPGTDWRHHQPGPVQGNTLIGGLVSSHDIKHKRVHEMSQSGFHGLCEGCGTAGRYEFSNYLSF